MPPGGRIPGPRPRPRAIAEEPGDDVQHAGDGEERSAAEELLAPQKMKTASSASVPKSAVIGATKVSPWSTGPGAPASCGGERLPGTEEPFGAILLLSAEQTT